MAVLATRPLSAGNGITVVDGVVSLADAEATLLAGAEQVTNKDQPSGYAGLDEDQVISANVQNRKATKAGLLGTVLFDGELATSSDTHELFVGDGSTPGGWQLSTNPDNSSACRVVRALGADAAANAALVNAVYADAKTLTTPNGAARSATNRVTIGVDPGVYDWSTVSGGLAMDTAFIDIVANKGPGTVVFVFNATNRLVRTASDSGIVGITFRTSEATANYIWTLDLATVTTVRDAWLKFEMTVSTQRIMSIALGGGNTLGGYARDCEYNCSGFYGGAAGITFTMDFIRCHGTQSIIGNTATSMGSSTSAGSPNIVTGKVWNCTYMGTLWNVRFGGDMRDTTMTCSIVKLQAPVSLYFSRFTTLDNDAAVNASVAFCRMGTSGIGVNVTNLLGATLAAAFNISDADA